MVRRIFLVALRNLLRQPFRTFLILQGVIWGTALGVFPPAVINGSMKLAETQASRLGTDRLVIAQDAEVAQRFDWEQVDRIRTKWSSVVRHCTGLHVALGTGSALTVVTTDSGALAARGMKLERGRFFSDADVREQRPVCVLEAGAVTRTFGDRDPLGQTLTVNGNDFEVIGIAAPRAAEGELLDEFGYHKEHPMRRLLEEMKQYVGVISDDDLNALNADNAVMVPHTTVNSPGPQFIEVRAAPRDVLRLKDQIQQDLSVAGYEPQIYCNAILPVLYGETLKSLIQLNRAVFVLSICVGTAIVCAIMVLSVLERQREIAIRRVEGARQWHIALQFIVETGTLCLVGGVAGVPLGLVIAMIRCALEPMGSVTWTFPPAEVSVLITVVTLVGFVGGLLPAWRAMRVDPVEMLRYD
jgi:putative ABC transport system permease protein